MIEFLIALAIALPVIALVIWSVEFWHDGRQAANQRFADAWRSITIPNTNKCFKHIKKQWSR